jgi:hypothetical protein
MWRCTVYRIRTSQMYQNVHDKIQIVYLALKLCRYNSGVMSSKGAVPQK